MFWIKEKFVSLHRKTEMKCSIGLWCNGNTTDSGPVIPGSNPGSPTTTHQQKKVCQNAPLLSFTHKAPTFTSWGFVIT
jgi:hypothetical protein